MGRAAIIGAVAAASLYGSAPGQDAPASTDAAGALAGAWEFSNADHDKICRFIFRAAAAGDGHRLDIDKNCPNIFPSTAEITAWAVDGYGTLRLLDAGGNPVIELTEAETGIYDGFQPGEGRYVLQSAAAVPAHADGVANMVGDWMIARGSGKPTCTMTLTDNPAGADALALRIKPGCDAFIARFNPTSWRMDQGDLILLSARGKAWRFEENDADTWQRLPESPDPVLLVRQ